MLVSNLTEKSELFNTLAEIGALSTDKHRITQGRLATADDRVEYRNLSYDDIERVGYLNPHFEVDIEEKDTFEVWINDEYINPKEITWVETHTTLYGVLPRKYDILTTSVKILYNRNLIRRYSNIQEEEGSYFHKMIINTDVFPYKSMADPTKCVYFIADGKISVPEVERLDSSRIQFTAHYTKSIDLFCCGDLAGVYNITANVGTYIDNPYSHQTYHRFVVDDDPAYPIETRFYPCILVDKDCTLRVYNDVYDYVPCPELTRLVVYPEFIDVVDPYNCSNEYLNNLTDVDDAILASDSDDVIIDKLSRIAAYCYRIWEKFPFFCNEQSDFLMCDNSRFGKPTFIKTTVYLKDRTTEAIISLVPFEAHRDVLFYNGMMFRDYTTPKLRWTTLDNVVEETRGVYTYFIEGDYDPDLFTVIKFNAAEDTVINNIGDWIDTENLVKLHIKLNKFYRNLLILRGSVFDDYDKESVYVSHSPPSAKDSHLWFELLVNAIPAVLEENPVEAIRIMGLDPDNVPEDIRAGAYAIDMDPAGGPQSYTELLLTYFKLGKAEKQYLALQYNDGNNDPTVSIYHDLTGGNTSGPAEINELRIDTPISGTANNYTIGDPPANPKVGDINVDSPEMEPVDDATIQGLLDGIDEEPVPEEYSLETISYMDEKTGRSISGSVIQSMTVADKIALITRYITEGTDEEKEAVEKLWTTYLDSMDQAALNVAVYKILLTEYAYNNAPNNPIPDGMTEEEAFAHNLTIILSATEPKFDVDIGAFWINLPKIPFQEYVEDIIANRITEGNYYLPEGFFDPVTRTGSIHFDFGAHGTEGIDQDLFVGIHDDNLHEIHYGKTAPTDPEDGAIWYEFLDEIDGRVCYSDEQAMVLKLNERLVLIQFDDDNITAFAFDDIMLNFRGKLGLRYLGVLADLVNSGVIKREDVNIFYKRLITKPDFFDMQLRRLYTGHSHVITLNDLDTRDYSVHYSTNVGRLHIDYRDMDVHNREREAAWRMVIDYSHRDIAFIGDRMMLFVNGQYIPRTQYKEITAGKIQLLNFTEVIDCVDFLYSKKDEALSRAKQVAMKYWNAPDTSVSIQRPERDYTHMYPIDQCRKTFKGYYDVLLDEYILNGRLFRILNYLQDHPEESEDFRKDLLRKFHAISDIDIVGMSEDDARIIIPAVGRGDAAYNIQWDQYT